MPEGVHAVLTRRLKACGEQSGLPDLRVHVVAVQRRALTACQDEREGLLSSAHIAPGKRYRLRRVRLKVCRQFQGHGLRKRNVPTLAALGRVEDESVADDLHLLWTAFL